MPEVDIVISYDPPRHITTYIHRIGRTARAGRPGTAITLVSPVEYQKFNVSLTTKLSKMDILISQSLLLQKLLGEVGKVITSELTTSTDLEETNAKKYQVALERLREQIMKDKRARILEMSRAKEMKELQTKDTSTMTLMEKLQMQATLEMHEKVDTEVRLGTKRSISRKFKPKLVTKKDTEIELNSKDKKRPTNHPHKGKKDKKNTKVAGKGKKRTAKDKQVSEKAALRKQKFMESLKKDK